MKYIIIDDCGDNIYTREFDTKEEAVKEAYYEFSRLTYSDKKRRKEFILLESVNPDVEAENHLDGNIVKRYM